MAPNDLPRDAHSVSTMAGGRHFVPREGPGLCILGILNPAFFGTIHTCLLAVALVHVSSCDVMGFEGLRSEVQLYRLDWAEGQTENTWVPVCRVSGLIRRSGVHVHHDGTTVSRV